MARVNSEVLGARQVFSITMPSVQETLLGTPETLPTTEPGTPQISYTIDSSALPTISPEPANVTWIARIFGAGQFTTGGTVYWRLLKNSSSVATGSYSVSSNYYYTVEANAFDVADGDTIELSLWASTTDANWDYKAFQVHPTRICLHAGAEVLYRDLSLSSVSGHPVLTSGNPSYGNLGFYPYAGDYRLASRTLATNLACSYTGQTYGIFIVYRGDYAIKNTGAVRRSSTYRPYYYRNLIPCEITVRRLKA